MNRHSRLLPICLGALLCVAGALGLLWAKPAETTIVLPDACRTPVRVLSPSAASARVAVVFHGYAASPAIMEALGQTLAESGWRVYLPDLAGHGRSLTPFSYERVDECAAGAVRYLASSGRLVPSRTIYVGHSLGAAVVIHLASTLPVAATVAISPALLVPPKRPPRNLLILAGQFDLAPVRKTARQLLVNAGGAHDDPADFAQGRAAALFILSGQLHGTMVLDPRAWKHVLDWAGRAVAPPAGSFASSGSFGLPLAAFFSNFALLAGMALLVSPAFTVLAALFRLNSTGETDFRFILGWKRILAWWAVAAFFAVSVLGLSRLAEFIKPVKLVDGDWSALVALLTGVVLVIPLRVVVKREFRLNVRGLVVAVVSGIFLVVLFSWAMRPELVASSLSGARLWRWAVLAVFTLPYFLAEEAALGPPAGRSRFLIFLAMRSLIWLAQAYAVLIFWPSGLLIALLFIGLAMIAVGQRLAADALRRRGLGVTAAAIFDAILAAGTLALVLPLI